MGKAYLDAQQRRTRSAGRVSTAQPCARARVGAALSGCACRQHQAHCPPHFFGHRLRSVINGPQVATAGGIASQRQQQPRLVWATMPAHPYGSQLQAYLAGVVAVPAPWTFPPEGRKPARHATHSQGDCPSDRDRDGSTPTPCVI
jgi:hypothetical protein